MEVAVNTTSASNRKPVFRKPGRRQAAFAALALLASPASAQGGLDMLAERAPVSDERLADMRGKFVSADAVSFFGISLATSWQDADGITTSARLVFNVDFLNHDAGGNPVTRLLVGWVRDGDPAMDVTENHEGFVPVVRIPLGDIAQTKGAAQANVIAGADNVARNAMQIAIVPASSAVPLEGSGLSVATGSSTIDFSDGDRLQFQLSDNGIGIAMTANDGLDSSLQTIGGGAGQALQQTILQGADNTVLNSASIMFGVDQSPTLDAVRMTEAISVMQGNGF